MRCEIPTFAAKPPSSFEKIPICTADGSTFETVSSTESTSLVRQVRFWAFLMQPPALAALDIDCLDVNFTAELNQSCSMMIPSYDFCGAFCGDMRGLLGWMTTNQIYHVLTFWSEMNIPTSLPIDKSQQFCCEKVPVPPEVCSIGMTRSPGRLRLHWTLVSVTGARQNACDPTNGDGHV